MNTVYVLFYGYRDERRVGGVFSTNAAARAAMRFGDEHSVIEAVDVDAPLPEAPAGQSLWHVGYCISLPEFVTYQEAAFGSTHTIDTVEMTHVGDIRIYLWARNRSEARQQAAARFEQFFTEQGSTAEIAKMKADLAANRA